MNLEVKSDLEKVKKAIIPAGGLGSRFLPASAAIPKEAFPVFDKPLIYYAIEELSQAGVEDVYLVVSPWKQIYFENFFNLKKRYERLSGDPSKAQIIKKLDFLEYWPKIHFVIQEEAKGLAQAIGLCQKEMGLDPFFVILPDEVFISEQGSNPSQSLLKLYKQTKKSCVGLFEVELSEVSSYGVADLGTELLPGAFTLKKLVEKPKVEEAPSSFMLPGRYLFDQNFWLAVARELEQIKNLKGSEEVHITDALDLMGREGLILGQVISGERFDAGRPEGLLKLSQFEFTKKG